MNTCEKEMYDFAYTLTQSAGVKLKLERRNSAIEIREKTSPMDIVTQHDLWIEQYLTEAILEKYHGHGIVAEECHNAGVSGNNCYTWIIDPIDGTVNYYRFARDYAVSLAVYRGREPVFGLVYDVAKDVMYSGKNGEIPTMNGYRLNYAAVRNNSLCKAVVGMSLRTIKELSGMGADVIGLLSGVQAHRYMGCASLELCRIANGEYDLFISSNVYTWDIAAAGILVKECGGYLVSSEREKEAACPEKLFVAAFRSPELWEETLGLFPAEVRNAFGCRIVTLPDIKHS